MDFPPHLCTGCGTCRGLCPNGAISLQENQEGFTYPIINREQCVHCDLCVRNCPVLNDRISRKPISVRVARADDESIRIKSSSGGVFSLLAQNIIRRGGIVFGAGFEKDTWRVVHQSAEDLGQLANLIGSKYVQSDLGDTFAEIRKHTQKGREIMFVGTPCQVAGLRQYLGCNADRVLMVDFICHGVPSPKIWEKYLSYLITKYGNGSSISCLSFRSKLTGWKRFSFYTRYANGSEYSAIHNDDPYMAGFLNNLYLRASCYDCKFRNLKSDSDLTLGDCWNATVLAPQLDDDKGLSLVLLNTTRGECAYQNIKKSIVDTEITVDEAAAANPALISNPKMHRKRGGVFNLLTQDGFPVRCIMRWTRKSALEVLWFKLLAVRYRFLRWIGLRK